MCGVRTVTRWYIPLYAQIYTTAHCMTARQQRRDSVIKDMSNKSHWELGKLLCAHLCGEKTLDEVMDTIELMLARDVWATMDKINPIGGHGPASPYDEPLIAETNYSAQLRYELETPVRQAKEVDKAYDKA
nr:MAG TPA: hypothetical protein [Caudoviricetes sp.]